MADKDRILTILRQYEGEYVAGLYQLTGCMVHSRIADLRRRGYRIECRRFGTGDYRYKLVDVAEPAQWDERGWSLTAMREFDPKYPEGIDAEFNELERERQEWEDLRTQERDIDSRLERERERQEDLNP